MRSQVRVGELQTHKNLGLVYVGKSERQTNGKQPKINEVIRKNMTWSKIQKAR